MDKITKAKVLDEITAYLNEELAEAADEARVEEVKRLLLLYKFLPRREYGADDVVIPSALVELRHGQSVAYYFIAPQGGGLVTRVAGRPVQVITPQSPLGEALLGKKAGDRIEIRVRDGVRVYELLSLT